MSGGKIRQIRRSQYISIYGTGAILDLGNESFVASDITRWRPYSGEVIHLKRLEHRLRKKEFRMPPVAKAFWDTSPAGLPYYRFPQWLFCPSCRKLSKWSIKKEKKGEIPRCENRLCKGRKALVPMRFVTACEGGHMGDIPWDRWAHSNGSVAVDGRCNAPDLEFRSVHGAGGGLGSLKVVCVKCKASRSLEGIAVKGSMKSIGIKCGGKQPWQYIEYGTGPVCDHPAEVLQRGATNLYYPATISALDIPLGYVDLAASEQEHNICSHQLFQTIVEKLESSTGGTVDMLAGMLAEEVAEYAGCESQKVLDLAGGLEAGEDENSEPVVALDENEVLAEEWPILTNPPEEEGEDDRSVFVAKIASFRDAGINYGLESLIDKLVLVRRLREVRVLRGFHRIVPGDDEMLVPADLGTGSTWLPGMEVFGEGIFISFSEKEITNWVSKNHKVIKARLKSMQQRYENDRLYFLPEPTARFVMLHTFAHLLMRQLSFECGYSASSLKERIYSAEPDSESGPMAGFLIYTADSDSEGSLGGLVRQGNPDRFIPTVLTALERGSWCSADPVCRELPGQGMKGLNRAACHSCSLVSETSCTSHNTMLDRMMVLGHDEKNGEFGFFAPLLSRLAKEVVVQ